MNVALAPCAFANSNTFCPASSTDIVVSFVSLNDSVSEMIIRRIARRIVEIAQ